MTSPSLDLFLEDGPSPVGVRMVRCKTALSPSRLPGLDLALNPYQGCQHDCAYCYAPSIMRVPRAQWPRVAAKANLPSLLAKEAGRKRGIIGLSTVTDPYQPAEERLQLTRRCLRELVRAQAKVSVLTKSDLVLRDLDLLLALPEAEVGITITTIDGRWAACLEPGAPPPARRLRALEGLARAGIDCYALIGPIIPRVTEDRMGELASAVASTGCRRAMTDRLRLRPGMLERFRGLPCAAELGEGFLARCQDLDLLARLEGEVAGLCVRAGVEARPAF